MHFNSICTKMLSMCLMALVAICGHMVVMGADPMFSLDKLGEYNTLIDCFTTIKDDFTQCNKKAQKRGEFVLKYVDESSSLGTILKCCGTWIVRDCWVAAAQEKCSDGARNQLHNLPSKFMPAINTMCEDYQAGSFYCFIPHLIGIGVFVVSALLIAAVIAIVIVVFRRRNRRKRIIDSDSEKTSNNNEEKLTTADA